MRYRIKTETLNNGTQYFTAQVCYTPPRKGRTYWWTEEEVWCSITEHGGAHNERCCTLILDSVRQHSEQFALYCITQHKLQLEKHMGEQVANVEYKYL